MKIKYSCEGFQSITTDSSGAMKDGRQYSPSIFFERMARREYGSKGCSGCVRCYSHAPDGSSTVYSAIVGIHADRHGGVFGRDVLLTIHRTVMAAA